MCRMWPRNLELYSGWSSFSLKSSNLATNALAPGRSKPKKVREATQLKKLLGFCHLALNHLAVGN